jgi:uncharacterized membrane protein
LDIGYSLFISLLSSSGKDQGEKQTMNKIIEFLKTTILGGLFVLLPIIILYLALGKVTGVLVALATPFADLFFPGRFDDTQFPVLVSIILLIGVSFVLGLFMLSELSLRFGNWIDRTILGKLAIYNAIKSLTKGFADSQAETSFKPALLKSADGIKEFVYIVEDHGDDNLTVMIPWTPTPFTGTIKIVPKDHVEPLDVKMGKLTEALSQWGIGAKDILSKNA